MATNSMAASCPKIAIEPQQWVELSALLEKFAPGRRVWAFGSRAIGQRVRRFSDLDLALEDKELSFDDMALLREALDESRLPFKVDVVQLAALTPEFRKRIEPQMVLVQEHESNSGESP